MSEEQKPKKVDKRSETSKKNMQRALAKRKELYEQRKKQKEIPTYEINEESESSSSDSDSEAIVIKPKKKAKAVKKQDVKEVDQVKSEIAELKQMIAGLTAKPKKKRESKPRKQPNVIQIVPPAPAPAAHKQESELDTIKKRILLQF